MAVNVPGEMVTLPVMLRNYGYHNAVIGKLHFLAHSNRDHRDIHPPYGFHHLEISDEPGCYEDAYRAWVKRKDPEQLDYVSLGLPPASEIWYRMTGFHDKIKHPERVIDKSYEFRGKSEFTHSAFVGEQTIEYIKSHKNDTFFCFSGFYSPHPPFVAPREFMDLYNVQDMPIPDYPAEMDRRRTDDYFSDGQVKSAYLGYYAMISEVDFWIGKIIKTLKELEIYDNTIIIFTSDHGDWMGDHFQYGKGYWAPDVISRVPLIFRVPEALGGVKGKQAGDIVECVDILPTILELAGIPVPPFVQGSLLPVIKTLNTYEGDGLGLCEYHGWKSLRMDGFRYVVKTNEEERLYDLEKDPWEYNNVACNPEYADKLTEARKLLIQRMIKIEQPLRLEWVY